MTSLRWELVREDFESAVKHFLMAARIHAQGAGGPDGAELEEYIRASAFMHAVQCGHTSLENGLLRIFKILGEPPPDEIGNWHDAVVRQAFRPVESRGAILPSELRQTVDETRRARNLAVRGYDRFSLEKGKSTQEAAAALAARLLDSLESFIRRIDPPEEDPRSSAAPAPPLG